MRKECSGTWICKATILAARDSILVLTYVFDAAFPVLIGALKV
jgi:hypothetical protein